MQRRARSARSRVEPQAPELVRHAEQVDRGIGAARRAPRTRRAARCRGRSAATMRSASVRLHEPMAAATKCCHSAARDAAQREQQHQHARGAAADAVAPRQPDEAGRGDRDDRSAAAARTTGTAACRTRAARPARADRDGARARAAQSRRARSRRDRSSVGSHRHFGDQLDLDAGAHRQLRDAEGAARMRAGSARTPRPSSSEQPLVTRCCSVNVGALLTRLITLTMRWTLVQVAERRVQRAQQVDRDRARRRLACFGGHVRAELADPGLAVLLGDVPGQEDQVAGAARTARRPRPAPPAAAA